MSKQSGNETFWKARPETAGRVRGRIETILDWAAVREYRTGENPARWRGHLKKALPEKNKVRKVRHHPALPFAQMGEFMAELRAQQGVAARALEFTILSAARANETIGAVPSEIDAEKAWNISAIRMKAQRDHRVPLCDRAREIIKQTANADWLFPAPDGRFLSSKAMAAVIDRMNDSREARGLPRWVDPKQDGRDVVPHGFRSSFRDWAGETTSFPLELAESALAHAIKGKTEAAYARGSMFEKRRKLMDAWAAYCGRVPTSNNIVPMKHG